MGNERILWSVTAFHNNYTQPDRPGDFVWQAAGGGCEGPRQWPLFHPSEADPEAGYRCYRYGVAFGVDEEPSGVYGLHLAYLTIAPRLSFVEVLVNGVSGCVYLRPTPSNSGEIRLHAGLHAAIYNEGATDVMIPAALLRRGENLIEFIARDGHDDVLFVEKLEARKRLDRMANGAGFVYQGLSLMAGVAPVSAVSVEPTVLYARDAHGRLWEKCYLVLELPGATPGGEAFLEIGEQRVPFSVPAAAFGHLRFEFHLLDGVGEVPWRFHGLGMETSGMVRRRRKWQVYLTPHAHTDIGYTHRQYEVAERLARNIDAAMELAVSKGFTYHLDSSWALEHWLATRSAPQRERLVSLVREGKIGVAANYVDLLTHTAALEDLIRNVTHRPLPEVESDFASVVDVASITSAFPDLLAGAGVKYLAHADNQDRGPFRLNGNLHRVSPFWWEGPAGGRILVWLAKMYCELRKVCGSPPTLSSAARGLDLWLQEYDRPEYAPDAVMLYGMEADNTDIDPQPAAFVEQWNATYAYPQLVMSDVSSFFRYVEAGWADRFAVYKGDGGAYWEDGALSSFAETMAVRRAQGALPAAERLESLAVIHGAGLAYQGAQFEEAWKQVLLYDEHTWGAFLSCSEPDALLAKDQWAVKEGFARNSEALAGRLLHVAAVRHSLNWNNDGREVVVYNPHNWRVSGDAVVEIAPGEALFDPVTGAEVPAVLERGMASQAVVRFHAEVEGLSYRRFVLRNCGGVLPPAPESVGPAETVLENCWYRAVIDPASGTLTSLYDKELGRELANGPLGQILYAEGGEGTRLCSNQNNLPLGNPTVSTEFAFQVGRVERDALGARVVLTGRTACGDLTVTYTLPQHEKMVDVHYALDKVEKRSKEAVYVAFPLALPGAAVSSDAHLSWVNWHTDQLPGGCKEWLPLQTGIHVAGEGAEVLLCSPDVPMFCVGDIVRGRWPVQADLTGGRIFSYVMNNYWHTNYKASQGGKTEWSYRLTSDRQISPARAYRLGWTARRPLYGHRISFQDFRTVKAPYAAVGGGTLAVVGPEDVALTTIKGSADGFVLRLQELSGAPQVATVKFPGRVIEAALLTDLRERDTTPLIVDDELKVPVPASGLATVRVKFR
ncbi:MAG TPA: glycoside hydrolase family 38 C-terminal domain-containing protein [Symbiobacteriaceae bacterium]|nr:glycoside hydrolase family 38 C-terminal domain-containing protein [Symbiobacteriaceae bacterium]